MGRMVASCLVVSFVLAGPLQAQQYDVVFAGGRVMDGTGNPWFRADVGIRDGAIVAVGRVDTTGAARVIDARSLVVAPGFIDLHSHADGPAYGSSGLRATDRRRRVAPNLVTQGITTVVVNHDGRSLWPIRDQASSLTQLGIGPNAIMLVGHGTVRGRAMGDDYQRIATDQEVAEMQAMVRQAMEEGAYGMSSGLEYVPGRWSDTREVLALAQVVADHHGVYITHERASGADAMWYLPSSEEPTTTFLDAVVETIEIAERTGVTAVQTHIKARGANYWGSSQAAIQIIERARARGVSIWADQYPYNTTGSDGSTVLIPGWAIDGGRGRGRGTTVAQRFRDTMSDPQQEKRVRLDIAHEISRRGAAENILVMEYPDPAFVGKTLAALAAELGVDAVDVAIHLQLNGDPARPGGAGLRGFSLSEYDIESYARMPWVATATDGWVSLPEDGLTHVRVYGTYPRKIAHYARDRGVLSVEDAIRSSTSLPAMILGLEDRGLVRVGMRADLAVLDLERLKDNSTFFEPHRHASGVEYVLVEGTFVVDGGELTNRLPGRVIKRTDRPRPTSDR